MPIPASEALARTGLIRRVWDAVLGRVDNWRNYLTGAGTHGRDKSEHTFMSPVKLLGWGELESLYYGDWVSARIVDSRPDHYFRKGFRLSTPDDQLEKEMKRLDMRTKLADGARWGRLWGGAGAVCGCDDGLTVDQPLAVERCRGVKFINVVDRRYMNPIDYYDNPSEPNFGQPRTYQITPAFGQNAFGPANVNVIVHESRIVKFLGTKVDPITQRRLAGWSYSALQRPYDVIRMIAQTYQAAGQLMYDASQAVLKVSSLFSKLTGPQQSAILQRIADADGARWSGRVIAIDKEEEWQRLGTPLAGVPELMDRIFLALGGATDTPLTEIFGRSPAGLNATGESDQRKWYESIHTDQSTIMGPAVERILGMLTNGKWDGQLEWAGLEAPDDLKEAQVKTEIAKKWQVYESIGAVSGEQVALIEFLDKDPADVIDEQALEDIVEQEYEMAQAPPPTPLQPMVTGKPIVPGSLMAGASSPGSPIPKQLPPVPPKADADDDTEERVEHQLLEDYAPDVIEWIKLAKWSGPKMVPLDQIDFSSRKRWRATKEPDKVHLFAKKIKKGELKPIILVKTPGSDLYRIMDGHHRTLACEELGRPVLAYIGKVDKDAGPWDEMHASQRSAPSLDAKGLLQKLDAFAARAEQSTITRGHVVHLDTEV